MFRRNITSVAPRMLRRFGQRAQERQKPVLKSPREIQIMREAGRIVAKVHANLRHYIRPGVTTLDIDNQALLLIQKYGASSAFAGYRGYPANVCVSVNDELVHGIPKRQRLLHDGDIVSVDIGVVYRGFIGDSAWTYSVGKISSPAQELLNVTEASLFAGIKQAVVGNRIIDISKAIQRCIEDRGLCVVREYTGHGVGRQMHEGPQVLNYDGGDVDGDYVLTPGLVIAIEPMVQIGTWETKTLKDNWTVVNKNGGLAAHFEHTIAVTNSGPEILTLI